MVAGIVDQGKLHVALLLRITHLPMFFYHQFFIFTLDSKQLVDLPIS